MVGAHPPRSAAPDWARGAFAAAQFAKTRFFSRLSVRMAERIALSKKCQLSDWKEWTCKVAEREGDAKRRPDNSLQGHELVGKPRRHSHLRCFVELRLAAATFRNLHRLPLPGHTDGHTNTTRSGAGGSAMGHQKEPVVGDQQRVWSLRPKVAPPRVLRTRSNLPDEPSVYQPGESRARGA